MLILSVTQLTSMTFHSVLVEKRHRFLWQSCGHLYSVGFLGDHFVKRFALCYRSVVCWPDCKPEGPLFSAQFVCLSVCVCVCLCVCVSLTGTSTLQRWAILMKLGHKYPTVIWFGRDHNGPDRPQRDRATPFWKFKKISKITELEFQNSGPPFSAPVSPVYCKKKFDSIRT